MADAADQLANGRKVMNRRKLLIEVTRLRPELAALVGLPGRRPDIVMRFGYGAAQPYSARRPVDAVLA